MRAAMFWCGVVLALGLLAGSVSYARAQDVGPIEEKWALPGEGKLKLKLGRSESKSKTDYFTKAEPDQLTEAKNEVRVLTPAVKPAVSVANPAPAVLAKPPARAEARTVKAPKAALPPAKPVLSVDGKLLPGAVLFLKLVNDPVLSGPVEILADGRAQLPLVGYLPLADKTLIEAEAAVRAAYADGFYVKPELTLTLRDTP
jgi:hypothetical protein